MTADLRKAVGVLRSSERTTVFSGAGISVESGVPPFRGPDGLWSKYDPSFIELSRFLSEPEASWKLIKEVFYDFISAAKPNSAHEAIARLQDAGFVTSVITQNIDGLHQKAGSASVCEFHGNTDRLLCLACGRHENVSEDILSNLPPECPACGGLLKPDFVFFGEPIPEEAHRTAFAEASGSTAMIVVGTTGEVMPAAYVPHAAKEAGAFIIEVNTVESAFTRSVTDLFLRGRAGDVLGRLASELTGGADRRDSPPR